MKINYLTPNLGISGGVKAKLEHCTRLAERGHEVTLVVTKRKKSTERGWFPLDKRVKVIALDPGELGKKLPDADVLIANHWPYCQSLPPSKGKLLVPRQIEEKIEDVDIITMRRRPDLWLPNSPGVERVLRSQGFTNTHVVMNGVNHAWFNPGSREYLCSIFTQLNLKKRRKGGPETLAVLGRIHKAYPELPIEAFGQRSESGHGKVPSWLRFHRVGPGKLPALYRKHGVFFYAALLDGFANSPAEAMASGSVVVTARNAGVPYVDTDVNCFTFEPGDNDGAYRVLSALVERWDEFVGSQDFLDMQREMANTMKEYDWEKTVDQLEAAIWAVTSSSA